MRVFLPVNAFISTSQASARSMKLVSEQSKADTAGSRFFGFFGFFSFYYRFYGWY
jgi:hypothetical protein